MKELTTTFILAGGSSSRMGQDKAKLILGGRSVLEGVLKTSLHVSENVIIMRAPHQNLPEIPDNLMEKVSIGYDKVPGQGPLQGIADALAFLPEDTDRVYVVSCDLPHLNQEWLLKLSNTLTDEWDVVCTLDKNIANPLLAIYRRHVLSRARLLLESNKRRPIFLWEGWRVCKLAVDSSQEIFVRGMNTPEEYITARKHFQNYD